MKFKKRLLCCAITTAVSGGVAAQGEEPGMLLEEVVVTAQRRTESLQDVSAAATALDADALRANAVTNVTDLQNIAPSISITDSGVTQSVNIRGIGLASNSPSVTAGVATYVDGLFQPPIVQANSFFDLQGVEVFRGPQGTFVGANSTGGAIFINSQDPVLDEFSGYGELSAGNYNRQGVEGAVNIPVTDDLAVRVAAFTTDRDSYYDDVGGLNSDAGKLDEYAARLGVYWNPGQGPFEMLLKTQTNDRKTGGYAYHPAAGTFFAVFQPEGFRDVAYDSPTANHEQADITSLELRYELDSGIEIRSLTGHQDKSIDNLNDADATAGPVSVFEDYYANEKQLSQEINIISPTDGRLDWVVGGYYQKNDIDVALNEVRSAGGVTITDLGIAPKNERRTTGVFAQIDYELVTGLELQLGFRHTEYDTEGKGGITAQGGVAFPPFLLGQQIDDLSGRYDDDANIGKVAINWAVAEDHTLYALVSKGYKPGGFNSLTSTFEKEEVMSYEAGWKASLWENRVRSQLTVFYNEYENFQSSILEPSTGFIGVQNLDDMTIQGVELEVQAFLGDFSMNANLGYTDSDTSSYTAINTRGLPPGQLGGQCANGQVPAPGVCFDYTPFQQVLGGGDALYAPELTYSVGIQYDFYRGIYTVTPRINYAYVDDQFTRFSYDTSSDLIESYGLLSASLVVTNDEWKVELYGTNLADEEYVSGQFNNNEFYGAPREYGVRLGYQF